MYRLNYLLASDCRGVGFWSTLRKVISNVPNLFLMRALTGIRLWSLVNQIEKRPSLGIIPPAPNTSGSTRNTSTRPRAVFIRFFSTTRTGTLYTRPESLTVISNVFPISSD